MREKSTASGAPDSVSAIDKDFPITAKDIGKATFLDPMLGGPKVAKRRI